MSRPIGSKNKPKALPVVVTTLDKQLTAEKPKVVKEEKVQLPKVLTQIVIKKPPTNANTQILMAFVDYIVERMDGMEINYYKRFAAKQNRPIKYVVAKSIMEFFRIKDQQIDFSKLL